MRKIVIPLSVAAILASILAINILVLEAPLLSALHDDDRNEGVRVYAYFRFGVLISEPVFDLRNVGSENSQADVTRIFLQFADKLKAKKFSHVVLAWRGEPKFMLQGDYFKSLGEEYAYQNPVYTFRTMPSHLLTLKGQPAFGSWEGGFLGVLKGQMDDFTSFQKQWWLDSALQDKN